MTLNYEISQLTEIDSRLSHLSKDQIHKLIEDYMGKKPVDEILVDYNLIEKVKVGLNKVLPALQSNRECTYCKQLAVWPVPARYIAKKRLGDPICFECQHVCKEVEANPLNDPSCTCDNCEIIRQQEAQAAANATKDVLNNLHQFALAAPVQVEELSFVQTLSLYSLCRIEANKASNTILPVTNSQYQVSFSPTSSFTKKCLQELFDHNAISILPESNPDAFEHKPAFTIKEMSEVTWALNILDSNGEHLSIEDGSSKLYKRLSNTFDSTEKIAAHEFVVELAIAEILEYAESIKEAYSNDFPLCQSLRNILTKLLKDYSVSELHDFVSEVLAAASEWENTHGLLQESDESVQEYLEPFYERMKSKKWQPKKHDREFYRSWLSESLYEHLLLAGDMGFERSIEFIWQKKLLPRFV